MRSSYVVIVGAALGMTSCAKKSVSSPPQPQVPQLQADPGRIAASEAARREAFLSPERRAIAESQGAAADASWLQFAEAEYHHIEGYGASNRVALNDAEARSADACASGLASHCDRDDWTVRCAAGDLETCRDTRLPWSTAFASCWHGHQPGCDQIDAAGLRSPYLQDVFVVPHPHEFTRTRVFNGGQMVATKDERVWTRERDGEWVETPTPGSFRAYPWSVAPVGEGWALAANWLETGDISYRARQVVVGANAVTIDPPDPFGLDDTQVDESGSALGWRAFGGEDGVDAQVVRTNLIDGSAVSFPVQPAFVNGASAYANGVVVRQESGVRWFANDGTLLGESPAEAGVVDMALGDQFRAVCVSGQPATIEPSGATIGDRRCREVYADPHDRWFAARTTSSVIVTDALGQVLFTLSPNMNADSVVQTSLNGSWIGIDLGKETVVVQLTPDATPSTGATQWPVSAPLSPSSLASATLPVPVTTNGEPTWLMGVPARYDSSAGTPSGAPNPPLAVPESGVVDWPVFTESSRTSLSLAFTATSADGFAEGDVPTHSVDPISLTLTPGEQVVSGHVQHADGSAAANATVFANCPLRDGWREGSFAVQADAEGAFTMALPAGDCNVRASADGTMGALVGDTIALDTPSFQARVVAFSQAARPGAEFRLPYDRRAYTGDDGRVQIHDLPLDSDVQGFIQGPHTGRGLREMDADPDGTRVFTPIYDHGGGWSITGDRACVGSESCLAVDTVRTQFVRENGAPLVVYPNVTAKLQGWEISGGLARTASDGWATLPSVAGAMYHAHNRVVDVVPDGQTVVPTLAPLCTSNALRLHGSSGPSREHPCPLRPVADAPVAPAPPAPADLVGTWVASRAAIRDVYDMRECALQRMEGQRHNCSSDPALDAGSEALAEYWRDHPVRDVSPLYSRPMTIAAAQPLHGPVVQFQRSLDADAPSSVGIALGPDLLVYSDELWIRDTGVTWGPDHRPVSPPAP